MSEKSTFAKTKIMKKTLLFLSLFASQYSLRAQTELASITPTTVLGVGNAYPFGDEAGDFVTFIYKNVAAFTMTVGNQIAFDLGALNDVPVTVDIYFSDLSSGYVVQGYTQVVPESQTPLNPYGNTTIGDYELRYTATTAFTHAAGNFAITFRNTNDFNYDQVLVYTNSSDPSGNFFGRNYEGGSLPATGSTFTASDFYEKTYIGGFKIFDIVPLPTLLTTFKASESGATNNLTWSSAHEDGGTTFHIERSADGKTYEEIGEMPARGSNSNYTFTDNAPLSGYNFYRLFITEAGGYESYSGTEIVRRNAALDAVLISPVPSQDKVTIMVTDAALLGQTAGLYDMHGSEIARVVLQAGNSLSLQDYAAGVYLLRLPNGLVHRLIKE